jgi:hypothetical protein
MESVTDRIRLSDAKKSEASVTRYSAAVKLV